MFTAMEKPLIFLLIIISVTAFRMAVYCFSLLFKSLAAFWGAKQRYSNPLNPKPLRKISPDFPLENYSLGDTIPESAYEEFSEEEKERIMEQLTEERAMDLKYRASEVEINLCLSLYWSSVFLISIYFLFFFNPNTQ